jgi:hypothetical protein
MDEEREYTWIFEMELAFDFMPVISTRREDTMSPPVLPQTVILSEAKNLALIFSFSLHHGPERDSSLRSE